MVVTMKDGSKQVWTEVVSEGYCCNEINKMVIRNLCTMKHNIGYKSSLRPAPSWFWLHRMVYKANEYQISLELFLERS